MFITFNDSKIALPVFDASHRLTYKYSCAAVKHLVRPTLASTEAAERVCPTLRYRSGMNGAYFLSFSAAIARVAASITSLGARAMPSL